MWCVTPQPSPHTHKKTHTSTTHPHKIMSSVNKPIIKKKRRSNKEPASRKKKRSKNEPEAEVPPRQKKCSKEPRLRIQIRKSQVESWRQLLGPHKVKNKYLYGITKAVNFQNINHKEFQKMQNFVMTQMGEKWLT